MSEPKRIQRQLSKGWRKPENTVYVGPGSKWGNPFTKNTQVRTPTVYFLNHEWELEGRSGKTNGHINYFTHPDGRTTSHMASRATPHQLVDLFRAFLQGGGVWPISTAGLYTPPSSDEIRTELAGKNLMCWCPLVDAEGKRFPCHADVLLEIANQGDAKGPRP